MVSEATILKSKVHALVVGQDEAIKEYLTGLARRSARLSVFQHHRLRTIRVEFAEKIIFMNRPELRILRDW